MVRYSGSYTLCMLQLRVSELTNTSIMHQHCHDLIWELFEMRLTLLLLYVTSGPGTLTIYSSVSLSLSLCFLSKTHLLPRAQWFTLSSERRAALLLSWLQPWGCVQQSTTETLCAPPPRLLPLTHTAHHSCLISGGGARRVAFTAAETGRPFWPDNLGPTAPTPISSRK